MKYVDYSTVAVFRWCASSPVIFTWLVFGYWGRSGWTKFNETFTDSLSGYFTTLFKLQSLYSVKWDETCVLNASEGAVPEFVLIGRRKVQKSSVRTTGLLIQERDKKDSVTATPDRSVVKSYIKIHVKFKFSEVELYFNKDDVIFQINIITFDKVIYIRYISTTWQAELSALGRISVVISSKNPKPQKCRIFAPYLSGYSPQNTYCTVFCGLIRRLVLL